MGPEGLRWVRVMRVVRVVRERTAVTAPRWGGACVRLVGSGTDGRMA